MTKEIATTGFDYSRLDKDTAGKLRYYAKSGRALVRKSQVQFIAQFGQVLSEARELLANHGDGTFCKWAKTEFDLSKQTVYNYVNAWDRCLSNGLTNCQNVSPTALYLLTHDDTPKSVRDKVLRTAVRQETVTKSDVAKLLPPGGKSKPPPAQKPPPPEADPFEDVDPFEAPESPVEAPEPETASGSPQPTKGRQRGSGGTRKGKDGKPPKQYPRSHWFKQWDQQIRPLCRVVDKIAEGVGEKHDPHHKAVQAALDTATEKMMQWMRIGVK